MYHQSREEQETIINYDRAGDMANLYTADPVMLRKIDNLVKNNPEQFQERRQFKYNGQIIAKDYTFPKRFITIRTKDIERNISQERRAELSERMKNINCPSKSNFTVAEP
ncbi:hypothetical protein AALB51_01790 [Lachnospiraceae bacterium 62-26]